MFQKTVLSYRSLVGNNSLPIVTSLKEKHDWRRTCLFGSFGATMGAPAYLFYAPWLSLSQAFGSFTCNVATGPLVCAGRIQALNPKP